MQFPFRDLTSQYVSSSYEDLVQVYTLGTASYFLDGLGNAIAFISTASIGQQILTADQPAPFAITASYAMNGGSGGGTSSISASYAITASYAVTYSYVTHTTYADLTGHAYIADSADVCDFAETASYLLGNVATAESASYSLYALYSGTASLAFESIFSDTASLAAYSNYAGSASYVFTASNAITASMAINTISASHALIADVSLNVPPTASYAFTASNLIGWNFTNTSSNVNVLSSDVPVVEISTGSYNAAFFDYVALSGSNTRAGIVFGSWVNGLINYTEVSSVDIGDTSKVTMSLALNGGNVQLLANVSDTTPWTVKALGRYL